MGSESNENYIDKLRAEFDKIQKEEEQSMEYNGRRKPKTSQSHDKRSRKMSTLSKNPSQSDKKLKFKLTHRTFTIGDWKNQKFITVNKSSPSYLYYKEIESIDKQRIKNRHLTSTNTKLQININHCNNNITIEKEKKFPKNNYPFLNQSHKFIKDKNFRTIYNSKFEEDKPNPYLPLWACSFSKKNNLHIYAKGFAYGVPTLAISLKRKKKNNMGINLSSNLYSSIVNGSFIKSISNGKNNTFQKSKNYGSYKIFNKNNNQKTSINRMRTEKGNCHKNNRYNFYTVNYNYKKSPSKE